MNEIKNRYELVFWIEARNCNYNGDPDFDNAPRLDMESGHGFMTDVSIKRKIRDYVSTGFQGVDGYEIHVSDGKNLNRDIAECVIEASGNDKPQKGKRTTEASAIARKRFFDVRTFGAVMTTGLNAGQIQGAVQIAMPVSYDEVQTYSSTITRLAYVEKDSTDLSVYDDYDKTLDSSKKRTMGRKTFCPYALFECHAFISANLAKKSGFSEKDFNILLESILNMYNFETSASKAGMQVVGPVVIFKHVGTVDAEKNPTQKEREALLGCTSAQKLFNLINVSKKDNIEFPRAYTDYNANIAISKLPAGVEIGFKYEPFESIIWGHIAEDDEWLTES
jgi:CRISPR-associated protein Csd2